jgi:hypothetical protein
MRTTLLLVVAAALLASAAARATYYLDERFEGAEFPPAGWQVSHTKNAGWYHGWESPPGTYCYAAATAHGPPESTRGLETAALIAPTFTVPAPTVLYYRFVYRLNFSNRGGLRLPLDGGGFYLYYVDTGERLVDLDFYELAYPWKEVNGSVAVAANRPLAAAWYVAYGLPGPGGVWFDVDTCQICDENLTAVAPASLGRVKALFR